MSRASDIVEALPAAARAALAALPPEDLNWWGAEIGRHADRANKLAAQLADRASEHAAQLAAMKAHRDACVQELLELQERVRELEAGGR